MIEWLEQLIHRTSPAVFVLCLILFLLCGAFLGFVVARGRGRRNAATSRKLGRRGHGRSMKLLRRYGFEVLETEVTAPGLVQIDGRLEEYVVRADALVRRKRRTYVAEFKGGPSSGTIQNRATRRQLLEYSCVFGTDGILLVNADQDRIHYVRFVSAAQETSRRALPV